MAAHVAASPGTQTFLFSDIEGSTRLLETLGSAAYTAVLERHAAILRSAFAAHGGREEATEGDSFFVLFDSALEAVKAAVEAQRALAAEPWPPGVEVNVRMGLHAGEASGSAAGLVGLDVNRAARIAAAAHGGQVVVSEAVRILVTADLGSGISLRGLGSHRLKDLREPQPLCQVVADGLRMDFPPLRSLDARPNNLPTQLTSFVGREAELAEACRLLSETRLLTLTGPGGTGKTRLSLQVAATRAEDYPDGLFFVPLETVRDPQLVAPRIAAAIGLAESGSRPPIELLRDWLAGKKVLLVLDNLEQVLDSGPIVAELLRGAPDLKIIATSRAPLHVSGEQEFPVSGLPTPPDPSAMSALERASMPVDARSVDPEVLSTYEAVRLFIARAGAVRPGFSVTNENAPAVAAICARLHGMPLAIELAAARVKLLSPDAILARLGQQLALLAGGSRDLPERQQTLRGAIAWSYDILDEPTRRLLDRLSVFSGGFDLEAVEAVCRPSQELGLDAFDGLASLADQSLLRSGEAAGEPRFSMLETIAEFAGEMLARAGEVADLEALHGAWFCELAERLAPSLGGEDQRALLDRLELEHDNVRAAIDRAAARGDGSTALRLAFAVWRYWQKRGHLTEARRRLDALAGEPWSHADRRRRARLMEALGGICWWQGDIESMRPAYEEAVSLWRDEGDRQELANALYNVSFVWNLPPDPGQRGLNVDPEGVGLRILEEALALYRETGDERGQANVLWGIGNWAFFREEPGGGLEPFREALELFRRTGDTTMTAWSLHMLGGVLVREGSHEEAAASMQAALRTFRDAGDTAGITLALDDMAQAALATGDLTRAGRLFGAARALVKTTGASLADFNQEWIIATGAPRIQDMLAPEDLQRLAAEGAAMTLDEIVAYALEEPSLEEPPGGDPGEERLDSHP